MIARLKTIVIVAVVTGLVWLYAEAESLRGAQDDARVIFSDGGDEWAIRPLTEGWVGAVKVRLEGSAAALAAAPREFLLSPGSPGFPLTEGEQVIDLRLALRSSQGIASLGVGVVEVEPATVKVKVTLLVRLPDVPIKPDLPGVELAGPAVVEPPRASVLASKATLDRLRAMPDGPAVLAKPTAASLAQVRGAVTQRLQALLALPPEVEDPEARIVPRETALTITARSRTETVTLESAQIQVLLPPAEAARYRVDLPDQPSIPSVTVTGPRDVVERFRAGEWRIIAVVSLSADDLAKRVESKRVSFIGMNGAEPVVLPPGVAVTAGQTSVRLVVKPVLAPIPAR